VTELTPNDAVGWSNLANVLLRAGELGDAGDAARHAVQLASSSSIFGARPHSIVLQVCTNVCLCCVDALCLLSMPACLTAALTASTTVRGQPWPTSGVGPNGMATCECLSSTQFPNVWPVNFLHAACCACYD